MKKFLSLISSLIGITLLVGLVLFLSEREHIKERMVAYLSDQLEQHTGWEVSFHQVKLTWPLVLHVEEIEIKKASETLLNAKQVSLSVNPWKLLSHRLVLDAIIIEDLLFAGLVERSSDQQFDMTSLFPEASDQLLFGLKIEDFMIKQLRLAPEFLVRNRLDAYPQLSSPFSLHLAGTVDPFSRQVLATINLTQGSQPAIRSVTTLSKVNSGWELQWRIDLPKNSILSDWIPLGNSWDYQLISQSLLSDALALQKGDLYLTCTEPESDSIWNYGTLRAEFSLSDDQTVKIEEIKGVLGPLMMEGQGQYLFGNETIDLKLNMIHSASLDLEAYGMQLKKGRIEAAVTGSWQHPSVALTFTADEGSWNGELIQQLSVGALFNVSMEGTIKGKVELHGVYHGRSLDLAAQFDTNLKQSEMKPFTFTFQDINGIGEVAAEGSWRYDQARLNFKLGRFEGQIGDYTFRLQEDLSLEWGADHFLLSPLSLQVKEGSFLVIYDRTETGVRIVIKVTDLPIGLLHAIENDFPADGLLTAELLLIDLNSNLKGQLEGSIKSLHLRDDRLNMPSQVSLNFKATYQDQLLSSSGEMTGLGPHPFEFKAALPLVFSLQPLQFQLLKDQDLSVQATMHGKIESFLELLPITTTDITGEISLTLNVGGTWEKPDLRGGADLTDLKFELLEIGASFQKGEAHVDMAENTITVKSMQAMSPDSGILTGTGTVELDPKPFFPFEFQLQLNKISLAPAEFAHLTTSGHLSFKGNTKSALIEGKLVTDALKIEIPSRIPELVHTVAVTYINQPVDLPAPTRVKTQASAWPLALNMEIDIPSRGYITGENWESEWQGNVVFKGTTDTPLLSGGITVVRGEYNFRGKSFQINQGSINFAGDFEKKTSIYLIASRDLDAIKVEVIVKGSPKHPAITFRSNPPLSQREILSWLLFNRGTSDIDAFQGSQLNESITDLASQSSEPDLLSQFQNRLGVDRIDINRETGTSNEVSVQVGKYISRGILVSVNRSVTAETNRVAIEAALMKNVKIQAEVGDDSEAQLLLKWKKDY